MPSSPLARTAIESACVVGSALLISVSISLLSPARPAQDPFKPITDFSIEQFGLLWITFTGRDIIFAIDGFFVFLALGVFGLSTLYGYLEGGQTRLSDVMRRLMIYAAIGIGFASIITPVAVIGVTVMIISGIGLQLLSAIRVGYGNRRPELTSQIPRYLSSLLLITLLIVSFNENSRYATMAIYPLLGVEAFSFLKDLVIRYWKMDYPFWSNMEAVFGVFIFLVVWSITMAVVFPILFPEYSLPVEAATGVAWVVGSLRRIYV